ncbi:amidohydrolase [Mycoplasmoides pirum]|uniref:amidohydrolase n=1 Tax=Mycoplasmoides pirum TaxID=2122 RepID=UPI0004883D52|nr:amidohydrolase [Mycoplasmoides pirum]
MITLLLKKIKKNEEIKIIIAKKIITMNAQNDCVEAVVIQKQKIIGYGNLTELKKKLTAQNLKFKIDKSFKENYIYPGFIEPHMHPQMLGLYLLNFLYIGFYDRNVLDKKILKGLTTINEIVEVMKGYIEANKFSLKPNQWINFWGFDPLLHDNQTLDRKILDQISTENPICVLHQSGHVMSLNTKALEISGYLNLDKNNPLFNSINLQKDSNKELTGIVSEPEAMSFAIKSGAMSFDSNLNMFVEATKLVSKISQQRGITTIADKGLGFPSLDPIFSYEAYLENQKNNLLLTRVHLDIWFGSIQNYGGWSNIEKMMIENNNDYVWIGGQKIILDGSIQGFTANLISGQKYVTNENKNGTLHLSDEHLMKFIKDAEFFNIPSHIHANGSGAIEKVIDLIEKLHPNNSNKFHHSIEHNQLVTNHQLARMHSNNIYSNFFVNHIYYWGDAHAKYTIGPVLIHEMNPTKSALINDVTFAFHSDDPVTPADPLFAIWVAVNRKSYNNNVYGFEQIIDVNDAIKAVTINAAKLINQEKNIGSIDLNKFADFTILENEINKTNKNKIKNIKIIGTILGGEIHLVK